METREKNAAVVLAAGRGSRMHSQVQKQFLLLNGKPVLCYSLEQFEACPFLDEIVLVTGEEEVDFCRREIVEKYGYKKVTAVVPGGKERYHSVYNGLRSLSGCGYVFIHDGARPFVDQAILARAHEDVRRFSACVVGMPVKDTIKLADEEGWVEETPQRSRLWMVQTPQAFSFPLILRAYEKLMESGRTDMTDDSMVVESMEKVRVRLTEGSYRNIKITTPEDWAIAERFCRQEDGQG